MRTARVERATKESHVLVELNLDGQGVIDVSTGVPFFDHMMSQLGKHSGFNLTIKTTGDVEVDSHHSVEDTSLAFGQALREALGDKAGIRRFGDSMVPLDEVLVQAAASVAIDFKDELLGYVSELIRARETMTAQLHALGLKVVPSSANFILFTGFSAEAPKLWSELLGKGVLIRDVGLPGYLRVTVGNEAENTLFITALKELI